MTPSAYRATALALLLSTAVGSASAQIVCDRRWCTAVNFAVGPGPTGIAAADFDGDRYGDVATAHAATDTVVVLINDGAVGFLLPVEIALEPGSGPHSITAVDLDNDGDPDLVVSLSGTNAIRLLLNSGGTFTPGAVFPTGGLTPRDVATADLDGNGFADVVTSNAGSGDVSVLLNTAGSFSAPATYAVDAGPRGLALAPIDADSTIDIVVASYQARTLSFLFNQGNGLFAPGSSVPVGTNLRPEDVVAADINGDGDFDLAAAVHGASGHFAAVLRNQGNGTMIGPRYYVIGLLFNGREPAAIVAADFELDNQIDLALANQESGDFTNLANLGGGFYSPPIQRRVQSAPSSLVAVDVNYNGSFDVVVANGDSGTVSLLVSTTVVLAADFEEGDAGIWSAVQP